METSYPVISHQLQTGCTHNSDEASVFGQDSLHFKQEALGY